MPLFKCEAGPPETSSSATELLHVTAAGLATRAVCQTGAELLCYCLSPDYLREQDTELGTVLSFRRVTVYAVCTRVLS